MAGSPNKPVRGQCLVHVCGLQGWVLLFFCKMVVIQEVLARIRRRDEARHEGDRRAQSVIKRGKKG